MVKITLIQRLCAKKKEDLHNRLCNIEMYWCVCVLLYAVLVIVVRLVFIIV